MGTRADFYLGRGDKAEWLGSIGMDGYPDGISKELLESKSKEEYLNNLKAFFDDDRDDVSLPEMGWPWPWNNSRTTDYTYAFDEDCVWVCCFGYRWCMADKINEMEKELDGIEKEECIFPDMKDKKNVTLGPRSGLIVVD